MHDDPPELDPKEPSAGEPLGSSTPEAGCGFIGGLIAGFIMFFVGGWIALIADMGTFKTPVMIVLYLIASFVGAIWLATRPSSRGFAIGIFLGFGAILLLMSICGHRGPIAP